MVVLVQIIFGVQPNLLSILEDELPAMECSSSDIRQNMEAFHSARQNYTAAESSDKIRRALTYSDAVYDYGDKVYYHRKKLWVGNVLQLCLGKKDKLYW